MVLVTEGQLTRLGIVDTKGWVIARAGQEHGGAVWTERHPADAAGVPGQGPQELTAEHVPEPD